MENDDLIVKPKRPKGENGYKVFSIRIKEEAVPKIDKISMQTGHSWNELIGIFFRLCGRTLQGRGRIVNGH